MSKYAGYSSLNRFKQELLLLVKLAESGDTEAATTALQMIADVQPEFAYPHFQTERGRVITALESSN